jgi:hypothetical protein
MGDLARVQFDFCQGHNFWLFTRRKVSGTCVVYIRWNGPEDACISNAPDDDSTWKSKYLLWACACACARARLEQVNKLVKRKKNLGINAKKKRAYIWIVM